MNFAKTLLFTLTAGAAAWFIQPATPQNMNAQDRMFVEEAAKAGMHEVHMGHLGVDKASSADVKKFGQRMIDDHSKANDELTALAKKKGITVPADPNTPAPATLTSKTGASFDAAYMQEMVTGHQKAVALFEKEASSGADAELKDWANKTLPTIRDHLNQAQNLSRKKTD